MIWWLKEESGGFCSSCGSSIRGGNGSSCFQGGFFTQSDYSQVAIIIENVKNFFFLFLSHWSNKTTRIDSDDQKNKYLNNDDRLIG